MAKILLAAAIGTGAAVAGAYTAHKSYKANKRAQQLESRRQAVRAARERRKMINTARRNRANAMVMGEFQGGIGTSQSGAASDQSTQASVNNSFINQIQDYAQRITQQRNKAAQYDMYGNVIQQASGAYQKYTRSFK